MPQANPGNLVRVHYIGKLDDGTVFDTSRERQPLEFTLGQGQVIPGFEQAVEGMNSGETKTAQIPADKAYGPYRDDMVLEVSREQIPPQIKPQVGQELELRDEQGQRVPARVTQMSDESITLDANHPLAGKSLTFDLELVEVVQ